MEGECAHAQAPAGHEATAASAAAPIFPFEANLHSPPPDAPAEPQRLVGNWHVLATYGQSSAPRSESFAEAGTLSVARDFRLGGNFKFSLEVAPLFVVGLTRVDLPARPRETVFAFAALPLVAFDAFPRSRVGLRLEAGAGFVWAFSSVPADGSHGNFYDVLGGRVRLRLPSGSAIAGGLRRSHISNLGVIGQDNPGLSFYTGVLAFEWGR